MKAISVCVMEGGGKIKLRQDIAASPETLLITIKPYLPHCLVGLEAGSTTSWLFHGLQKAGVNVVCMEVHHARKALSAQPVKNDRNDAECSFSMLPRREEYLLFQS
jgi:transposase